MAAANTTSAAILLFPLFSSLALKDDFSLGSMVVTLRKLDARDKFTKIIQYGARFLYWWHATKNPALSRRAYKLYRTTRLSRKSFRILKSLEEVFKLWEILSRSGRGQRERAADLTDVLQGARCLTMCALWAYDNLLYLDATDTVDFCAERATRGFSRAWSVGSALLIWLSLMELQKARAGRQEAAARYAAALERESTDQPKTEDGGIDASDRCAAGEHGAEDGATERRREEQETARLREAVMRADAECVKSWLMVVKGVMDLLCATNMPGVDIPRRVLGYKLNDGVVAAAGCVSGLCVLYNCWPTRPSKALTSLR